MNTTMSDYRLIEGAFTEKVLKFVPKRTLSTIKRVYRQMESVDLKEAEPDIKILFKTAGKIMKELDRLGKRGWLKAQSKIRKALIDEIVLSAKARRLRRVKMRTKHLGDGRKVVEAPLNILIYVLAERLKDVRGKWDLIADFIWEQELVPEKIPDAASVRQRYLRNRKEMQAMYHRYYLFFRISTFDIPWENYYELNFYLNRSLPTWEKMIGET
ncbi:hypothetical protein METP3_00465 [Methanosarcinales archaeon]|nr:hypothetical protein METP3_00465 [Methanosarcinales archaeon]